MYLDRAVLRTINSIALMLLVFGAVTHAQRKPQQTGNLIELERAADRATADDDKLVSAYAVANPNNAKALELLGRLRLREGRLNEAASLFERSLALDPRSVSAAIGSGRALFNLGQVDEGRRVLLSIDGVATSSIEQKLDLAAALLLVGEVQRSLLLTETLPTNIKNSTALPLLTAVYAASGQADRVTAIIPTMKRAAAANVGLALACADVLRDAHRFNEAILVLSSVAKLQSQPGVLVSLARLEIAVNDFTHARAHLKRAGALRPDSVDVISAQAFLDASSGDLENAFKLISKARELAPGSTAVLADFVVIAMRLNNPQAAADAARSLTVRDPQNAEFRYLYGAASLQNGDLDTAQKILEAYALERPQDSRGCLALAMTFAGGGGQADKARRQLSHCIEIDPSNFEARYQLGLSYKSAGDNKQAVELLDAVVKQEPNYPLALRDLGALCIETGDATRARTLLEKAAELNPNDADTHFQLARLYSQIGETELAKKQQEIFRQLRGPRERSSQ